MPAATREEMLALAGLPVEQKKGLDAWQRAWVPWLGNSHLGYESTGCAEQLLTHLAADRQSVYLLHGEDIYVLPAFGPVTEVDGIAWVEVFDSERPWLMEIHARGAA